MRRTILTLAAAALGLLTTAGEASACHKKKCTCAAPVVAYTPAPCAPKVKHGHKKMFAHKAKAACATPVAYATYTPTVMPSGQYPTGQMMH